MLPITKIEAEGEPADHSRRGGGSDGWSGTAFISGGFHRQILSPTHHSVSGLPSHLILLSVMVNYPLSSGPPDDDRPAETPLATANPEMPDKIGKPASAEIVFVSNNSVRTIMTSAAIITWP